MPGERAWQQRPEKEENRKKKGDKTDDSGITRKNSQKGLGTGAEGL